MSNFKKADCSVPFAGSGKLSDFKQDGSWMMNQINKGYDKIERGIDIIKDEFNNIQFASVHKEKKIAKIAAKIINASQNININKYYFLQDNTVALKWEMKSELNGINIEELNIMKDLLSYNVNKDLNKINYFFNPNIEYIGDACLDFNKQSFKMESVITINNNINMEEVVYLLKSLKYETN